jgi:hypothetical protein
MSTLQRLPDWNMRLDALARSRLMVPFAWGTNDCFAFAADAVQALTGVDELAGLRGPHRTWKAAYRRHARTPGGALGVIAATRLLPVDPRLAQRGDLVRIAQPFFDLLAICNGDCAIAPGLQGLEATPLDGAISAWRVG